MSEINAVKVDQPDLTPEQTKAVEDYNNLSPEERTAVNNQIEDIQAKVAEGLVQASGWDILKQLYRLSMQRLMLTSQFTIPVLKLREQVVVRLSDPEGFNKSFQTLCNDVQAAMFILRGLGEQHLNRGGSPAAEDLALVQDLVTQYNAMLTSLETTVDPLMFSLHEIVLKECADLFEVLDEPEQAQ